MSVKDIPTFEEIAHMGKCLLCEKETLVLTWAYKGGVNIELCKDCESPDGHEEEIDKKLDKIYGPLKRVVIELRGLLR